MDEDGSYMAFVWVAYAIAFVILGGVTILSILRNRKLKKQAEE